MVARHAGMRVRLQRINDEGEAATIKELRLNADGRSDGPLLACTELVKGRYRLLFDVAPYFRARGAVLAEPAFVDVVPLGCWSHLGTSLHRRKNRLRRRWPRRQFQLRVLQLRCLNGSRCMA